MFALYDDQRQNLIRLGITLAVAAAAVLPFTISPTSLTAAADTVQGPTVVGALAMPGRIQFPTVALSRDPFVPDQTTLMRGGVANDPSGGANPNSEASMVPIVRAVVTGEEARALIDSAGAVQVLGVGDRLGNETVTAIDATGVSLSSGIRLVLARPQ